MYFMLHVSCVLVVHVDDCFQVREAALKEAGALEKEVDSITQGQW